MTIRNWERAKVAAWIAGGAILGASLKSYFDSDSPVARTVPRQPAWRHGVHIRSAAERRRVISRV